MELYQCTVCPRECGAERRIKNGFCGGGSDVVVARADLHMWEEPCISGRNGSGAVFFSGCSLRCVFCQNHEISHEGKGEHLSTGRLSELFLMLQERGAENINLVNPTHYTDAILEALDRVRDRLHIPVVWNTGGYEKRETVECLRGYVDIFLPDMKYVTPAIAKRYSGAPDYFRFASQALEAMFDVAGYPQFDGDGRMKKGVLVRHLVLPSHQEESYRVLEYLAETFDKERLYISLMSQYFPTYRASEFPEINRRLTTLEYQHVLAYAEKLGLCKGFRQQKTSAKEEYVPLFYDKLPEY